MPDPDPLTATGCAQADALGGKWSNVRIDHLFSSTLERAVDTAHAISAQNTSHPKIEQNRRLVEHHWGKTAIDYWIRGDSVMLRETITGPGYSTDRKHVPSGRGESYHNAGVRAREFVESEILGRFGVCLSEDPTSRTHSGEEITAETLPEGIPHVVVVSHNVFLTELYEGLLCWNKDHHQMTNVHWSNATW
jgi:Fructose-2,6-bisphosphatase